MPAKKKRKILKKPVKDLPIEIMVKGNDGEVKNVAADIVDKAQEQPDEDSTA